LIENEKNEDFTTVSLSNNKTVKKVCLLEENKVLEKGDSEIIVDLR
jgi:hypothetical protein